MILFVIGFVSVRGPRTQSENQTEQNRRAEPGMNTDGADGRRSLVQTSFMVTGPNHPTAAVRRDSGAATPSSPAASPAVPEDTLGRAPDLAAVDVLLAGGLNTLAVTTTLSAADLNR